MAEPVKMPFARHTGVGTRICVFSWGLWVHIGGNYITNTLSNPRVKTTPPAFALQTILTVNISSFHTSSLFGAFIIIALSSAEKKATID